MLIALVMLLAAIAEDHLSCPIPLVSQRVVNTFVLKRRVRAAPFVLPPAIRRIAYELMQYLSFRIS
jgi:hypothetical protein